MTPDYTDCTDVLVLVDTLFNRKERRDRKEAQAGEPE